ncbi:MAG: MFS transporter, partial [Candidatus Tectomicrobia bacterium]|nr:MFS transporter [Candidatus Tectomicrobia bacterium]
MLAYRWWIVLFSFFTLAISRGMQVTFTVFYPVLAETFRWSRASTAGVFSLGSIVDGIASPLTGALVDR